MTAGRMQDSIFIQEAKALAGLKSEMDSELVAKAAQCLVEKLSEHWVRLRELAEDDVEKNQVAVAIKLTFSFASKQPAGGLAMSYASRVTDGETFRCDDPDQMKMEIVTGGGSVSVGPKKWKKAIRKAVAV